MRRSVRILATAAILAATLTTMTGCIERRLLLRSDPPGASAFVDGILIGPTPVSIDFEHYGHHTVVLRKRGFVTMRQVIDVSGPWYLSFPFDLFTEHLWIGGHLDLHEHEFALLANDPASEVEAFVEEAAAVGVPLGDDPPAEPDAEGSADESGSANDGDDGR